MQQTARQPTYSPAEILEAGRKAESDGRRDYAIQFYRHLTEFYAATPEAAQARQGLQRLAPAPQADTTYRPAPRVTGTTLPRPEPDDYFLPPPQRAPETWQETAPLPRVAAPAPPVFLPAPARGYLAGRIIAWILIVIAGLMVLAGIGLLGHALMQGISQPTLAGATAIVAAPSLIGGGLLLGLIGELCRAAFRAVNATIDLAAIQRALAEAESREGGR